MPRNIAIANRLRTGRSPHTPCPNRSAYGYIEQKFASSNIWVVSQKLQQQRGESRGQGDRAEKKVKAEYVRVKDIKANVKLSGIGSAVNAATLEFPSIELKDVGTNKGQGVLFSEFLRRVVSEIFTAVVKSGLPK